ncbi:MAG: hypothetical protein GY870_20615 [archaeon]|nr:hypothetical protein [archaeon]
MEKSKKKEKFIGVRLNNDEYKEFTDFAEKEKISKGKLTRKAINTYLNIYNQERKKYNPKLIMSKNMVKFLFDSLDEQELKDFSEISVQNTKEEIEKIKEIVGLEDNSVLPPLRTFLKTFIQDVFEADGQNWLDNIVFRIQKGKITIAGTHLLGSKFSKFIELIMVKNLEPYNVKLLNSKLTDSKVILNLIMMKKTKENNTKKTKKTKGTKKNKK